MNAADRTRLETLKAKLKQAVSLIEEWQDIDRISPPGHTDMVFCNYGSGRSDR